VKDELPDLGILRSSWPGYADPATTHEVEVAGVRIGGPEPVVIAGPCAVESYEQTMAVAAAVRAAGGRLLRGGAYKPRTNPHSFQGLGREGLEILAEARRVTGLGIVTEVLDPRLVGQVAEVADMLQVGSRSMQNFPLLVEVGRSGRPVLLKRGWSATLAEWLCAAEYVALAGSRDIVLCERGIRVAVGTEYTRSMLDLQVFGPAKSLTPLPVIADPSHATGDAALVPGMSRAAIAAGAHGLLIEVVLDEAGRRTAKSDGRQGVTPDVLAGIIAAAVEV
jgi:3-deoxy-7-phosphoheptulonate synthase